MTVSPWANHLHRDAGLRAAEQLRREQKPEGGRWLVAAHHALEQRLRYRQGQQHARLLLGGRLGGSGNLAVLLRLPHRREVVRDLGRRHCGGGGGRGRAGCLGDTELGLCVFQSSSTVSTTSLNDVAGEEQ